MSRLPLLLALVAVALGGWTPFWADWFDDGPGAPDREAIAQAVQARVEALPVAPEPFGAGRHAATAGLYRRADFRALFPERAAQRRLTSLLAEARADGLAASAVHADAARRLGEQLADAEAEWRALPKSARDTLADPRPALVARLDVALADGLLRYGDALLGLRVDAAALHRGTWFPTPRDSTGARRQALADAIASGEAERAEAALRSLAPAHAGYRALRERLAALHGADLAPVPAGAPLAAGDESIRVPHLRGRLVALGYLAADSAGAWGRPRPYRFDGALAAGVARFQAAQELPVDSTLGDAETALLNADADALRRRLALNLERWRWLPDDLGAHYVWSNLAAFDLRVYRDGGEAGAEPEQTFRMPINIGTAQTTGWTTPVITDSITSVIFRPAWYVPRSLVYSNVLPMARADSLALWRQGFDVTQNGVPVDSRLVKWDSVDTSGFRFVQRPGAANPLGRVKFPMTNPYAILIHDTNRPTLRDGRGGAESSGCLHAGDPEGFAEYLLQEINGWNEGRAASLYRNGPRQGVRLDAPMRTHFVYFTAAVENGALRLFDDPYGYDRRLADALARVPGTPAPRATGRG